MTDTTADTTNGMPTLTSQLTNASSDTDFTEITTGTSIKTHDSYARLPLSDNNGERDHDRLSNNARQVESSGQRKKHRDNDIRQSYQAPPPIVPDIEAEMEKWFEVADR